MDPFAPSVPSFLFCMILGHWWTDMSLFSSVLCWRWLVTSYSFLRTYASWSSFSGCGGLLTTCSVFNENLMGFGYIFGKKAVKPNGSIRQKFFPKTIYMKSLVLVVISLPQQNHYQNSDSCVITHLSISSAWGSTARTPASDINKWLRLPGAEGSYSSHGWAKLFTSLVILGGGLAFSKLFFLLLQPP